MTVIRYLGRFLGIILLGLSFLIGWPLHIILSFAALATIVWAFIDIGIIVGIISIPLTLISFWVLHILLDLLLSPLHIVASLLLRNRHYDY